MNEDTKPTQQDNQCCQDTSCCTSCSPPPKKDKRTLILRILASAGVLLIAAGVTAYVLIARNPGQAAQPATDAAQSKPAVVNSVIGDLNWVKKISQSATGQCYTFALLPGSDEARNADISGMVRNLGQQLERSDIRISFIVLERSDPEYQATLNRLLINNAPAVVGLNSAGNIAIIKDKITFERLYETYLISSATCCPPSGSNCCGSN